MIPLFILAFISGIFTIAAPYIWPILPIILHPSVLKNNKRPLGITFGVIVSFGLFTLTISYMVMNLNLNTETLRLFAASVIGFLGVVMIFPKLKSFVEVLASKPAISDKHTGFFHGFLTGIALGIIWSPLAGPLLAGISSFSIKFQTPDLILLTIFYVLGIGLPLILIIYGGQNLSKRIQFLSTHTGKLQKVFGVITILIALAIFTNYDKLIQAKVLEGLM